MRPPVISADRHSMADAEDVGTDDGDENADARDGAPDAADDVSPPDGDAAGSHPFVFLVGLLLFLASSAAFLADLVTGHDVLRSLALNGLGTLVLVAWAANDTLVDPDAEVSTLSGAGGTALLLVGVYLLVAAVGLALTSFWHDRLGLAPWLGGTAVVLAVVGFAVFPVGAFLGEETESS